MDIVIVGCGKVGASIAVELNSAGHDIVVVDTNGSAVSRLADSIDAMGVEGNGATYEVLSEAGVSDADLVVAATARDEVNLYTCLMAKASGAKHTIARVRSPEYTDDLFRVKDLLGLSMSINPELTAAVEISRLLRFSGAIEIDAFSKGAIELIKVEIPEGSSACNRKLSDIGDEVYIPNGDFTILQGDRVTVVTKPETAIKFFKKMNINIGKSKDVMILGGGKISYYLAQRLIKTGANVKIIEQNAQRCEELSQKLPDAMIIHGDCMDQALLLSEGITHVDGVAALMDYDEENILISLYIKGVSKANIITKVNNQYFDSITDKLGLDCVINPKKLTGEYIARYIRAMQNSLGSNVETLYRLNENRIEALEFRAKNSSKLIAIPIEKLNLKDNLQIISIFRKGKIILPTGKDAIMPDDLVVVITKHKGLSDLDDILSKR